MKSIQLLLLSGFLSVWANGVVGQLPETGSNCNDATTPEAPRNESIKIDSANINVLSASVGNLSQGLQSDFRNHMNLWVAAQNQGTYKIDWKIQAAEDGIYAVDVVALPKGSKLILTCNGQQLAASFEETQWERIRLGQLNLRSGQSILQLTIEAKVGFAIDSIELTQSKVKVAMQKDALAMRQRAAWFKAAGYGVMFQWTNRATPPTGAIKPWEEKVNDFDVQVFADLVQEMGAAYVVWSITWGQQYISAPIQSLDHIIPGRTTKRDLLGEMADALHKRGIKLIFYYHYGYDCGHSIDAEWMKACGGYAADKTKLYQNLIAIVSEVGERYGGQLNGWWFDGGQRYYDCHFDNTSSAIGILSAPFKEFTLAARNGNTERLVAYNSWIKPKLTEYQDYYGGEGHHLRSGLEHGIFTAGGQAGLLGHGCFILEKDWGHIHLNTIISKPKYDQAQLSTIVRDAQKQQYPVSINLEMYEDGSVSPASEALLKQLRNVIRGR